MANSERELGIRNWEWMEMNFSIAFNGQKK